jgi:hypothetical protein
MNARPPAGDSLERFKPSDIFVAKRNKTSGSALISPCDPGLPPRGSCHTQHSATRSQSVRVSVPARC